MYAPATEHTERKNVRIVSKGICVCVYKVYTDVHVRTRGGRVYVCKKQNGGLPAGGLVATGSRFVLVPVVVLRGVAAVGGLRFFVVFVAPPAEHFTYLCFFA